MKINRVIIVTNYNCQLSCTYCRTEKKNDLMDPSIATEIVKRIIRPFGVKVIKTSGGEPLLNVGLLNRLLEETEDDGVILELVTSGVANKRIYRPFVNRWKKRLYVRVSIDGRPETYRQNRGTNIDKSMDFAQYVKDIIKKLVINVTISPERVTTLRDDINYLLKNGFYAFNLLPVYYNVWPVQRVLALRKAFDDVAGLVVYHMIKKRRPVAIENLFFFSPTVFFNSGLCVDTDGRLYSDNLFLWQPLSKAKKDFFIGTLQDEPSTIERRIKTIRIADYNYLSNFFTEDTLRSTWLVDRELSRFVKKMEAIYRVLGFRTKNLIDDLLWIHKYGV